MASFFGNMFDQTKPGPGVPKDEPQKPGIVRFFTVYFRKFWKIVSLNAFYFIAAIPAFIILYFVGTYFLYGPISSMLPGVNEGADAPGSGENYFNVCHGGYGCSWHWPFYSGDDAHSAGHEPRAARMGAVRFLAVYQRKLEAGACNIFH